MRTPEDAKLNPMPGDKLRKGRFTRHIGESSRFSGEVVYRRESPTQLESFSRVCSVTRFRHWSATAHVVNVAQLEEL